MEIEKNISVYKTYTNSHNKTYIGHYYNCGKYGIFILISNKFTDKPLAYFTKIKFKK